MNSSTRKGFASSVLLADRFATLQISVKSFVRSHEIRAEPPVDIFTAGYARTFVRECKQPHIHPPRRHQASWRFSSLFETIALLRSWLGVAEARSMSLIDVGFRCPSSFHSRFPPCPWLNLRLPLSLCESSPSLSTLLLPLIIVPFNSLVFVIFFLEWQFRARSEAQKRESEENKVEEATRIRRLQGHVENWQRLLSSDWIHYSRLSRGCAR